ncbi:MAG: hypothetical protein ACYDH9_26880 [Limisphaerales bacterium]
MKRKRWILALVVLALIATLVVVVNLPPKEPLYEGKPEGFWVDQLPASLLLNGGRGVTRMIPKGYRSHRNTWEADVDLDQVAQMQRKARRILEQAGTNGLAYLMERLTSREYFFERMFVKRSSRHPFWSSVYQRIWKPPVLGLTSAEIRRAQALTAIVDCYSDKNEVVPPLLKILKGDNPDAVEYAKWALRKIDPAAATKAGVN